VPGPAAGGESAFPRRRSMEIRNLQIDKLAFRRLMTNPLRQRAAQFGPSWTTMIPAPGLSMHQTRIRTSRLVNVG